MVGVNCPVCGCKEGAGFIEGEQVYIDYGFSHKVTPDNCLRCGYLEGNGTPAYPGNYQFIRDCWERQFEPC